MAKTLKELDFYLNALEQTLKPLEQIQHQAFSDVVRDATIQRFERAFELSWKLFGEVARFEGMRVGSPRQAIRAMHTIGLLTEVDDWFVMLDDRNRIDQTYDAVTREQVYESACNLPAKLRAPLDKIRRQYLFAEDG